MRLHNSIVTNNGTEAPPENRGAAMSVTEVRMCRHVGLRGNHDGKSVCDAVMIVVPILPLLRCRA